MKRAAIILMLLVLAAGSVMAAEIDFAGTYDEALKAASEKNQPVLVTFYTDW